MSSASIKYDRKKADQQFNFVFYLGNENPSESNHFINFQYRCLNVY